MIVVLTTNVGMSGWVDSLSISDASRDLVPFVQLENREKHPWNRETFSKITDLSLQLYLK